MKYIRITTTQVDCRTCQGSGFVWDKEYHNQLKRLKCYLCDNGKITIEHHEDVTVEIQQLESELKYGFFLTNKQKVQLKEWVKSLPKPGMPFGAIDFGYTYSFIPNSLGLGVVVKRVDGFEIDLTDYDSW